MGAEFTRVVEFPGSPLVGMRFLRQPVLSSPDNAPDQFGNYHDELVILSPQLNGSQLEKSG